MIKNERQYRITKAQAARFEQTLRELMAKRNSDTADTPTILERAQEDAIKNQLSDLGEQIAEYDALREGRLTVFRSESLDDLPQALIRARIAAGLSQKELAEQLGMKEQQIQKYEATAYSSASFSRMQTIVKALGLQVREEISLTTRRN